MGSSQKDPLPPFFSSMKEQGGVVVRDAPKFDLDLYISNYRGRTRFDRLLLIGRCSVPLSVDALKAAVVEAKKGNDVGRYREALEYIRLAAPNEPEAVSDQKWVDATEQSNKATTRQLESELKGYKNNLVKESIRMAHRELGEHLEKIGDLAGAAEAYIKMRPDSNSQAHVIDVCKHLIGTMVQKRDWAGVLVNVHKLAASSLLSEDANRERAYQKAVAGLAYLGLGRYYDAAVSFLEVGVVPHSEAFNELASPNDIATYGGLLALASMSRAMQSEFLESPTFRSYLELEPHIRKAVSLFVNGRYSACLEILESYRADYLLDLYLQPHVDAILSQIRRKCITCYFWPFSCVTLESLSKAFAKPGESLEDELISMIKEGVLRAQINTIDKLLVAVSVKPRAIMQSTALQTVRDYEREAVDRIRRMNLAAADLEIKGSDTNMKGRSHAPGMMGEIFSDHNRAGGLDQPSLHLA
ncbi:PCI-domain-containing protein [Xylariaceae sp. FL0594]|nr:PCI-domain-containing protein [Xylariaceae sp. FL0594]